MWRQSRGRVGWHDQGGRAGVDVVDAGWAQCVHRSQHIARVRLVESAQPDPKRRQIGRTAEIGADRLGVSVARSARVGVADAGLVDDVDR